MGDGARVIGAVREDTTHSRYPPQEVSPENGRQKTDLAPIGVSVCGVVLVAFHGRGTKLGPPVERLE